MSKKLTVRQIAFGAIAAAAYVALTSINPLAFREIQFRFSEILVLFFFYYPIFCIPMIICCLFANIL
ncbi:MAG: QueT transporter family protein [Oscillospiraceae bacterium]|nr:QueT transporter family protein [Oscillospiraceae bacterium]